MSTFELLVYDAAGQPTTRFQLSQEGDYQIGREHGAAEIVLPDDSVSRRHASIRLVEGRLFVTDLNSTNGTRLGGNALDGHWYEWTVGTPLQVGIFTLALKIAGFGIVEALPHPDDDRTAAFGRASAPGAQSSSSDRGLAELQPSSVEFPGSLFDRDVVRMQDLRATGNLAGESIYLAIGGGFGSFAWVDHLRCYGVAENQIRVVSVNKASYQKWKEYCMNSQIPLHERIRSNSISTPDNIWGFPGYASREAWRSIAQGDINGLRHVFQVFGEPALAETYTPRSVDVHASMDREEQRIGWSRMLTPGRAIALRKTDDGRYVLAYRIPADMSPEQDRDRFWVARFVHIATGYPTTRYLDDLQRFKRQNRDSYRVVNAYEQHEAVYRSLVEKGGTVVVRGRGIVASRVLQRLYETRAKNRQIGVLHLVRGAVKQGSKYRLARRPASHDVEIQPFNWPKACWGGTYRKQLDEATPEQRLPMLAAWGGTTTADRTDWVRIIEAGKREGWYRVYYGDVKKMRLKNDRVVTEITAKGQFNETLDLVADFVIDCTGLIADATASPFLKDLIERYNLPRNPASGAGPEQRLAGISVTNQFEIKALRHGEGRVYAAGVVTQNGPAAAVDSFLGLQYAAIRSVDHLSHIRAPGVGRMGPLRSFGQWLRWCAGTPP